MHRVGSDLEGVPLHGVRLSLILEDIPRSRSAHLDPKVGPCIIVAARSPAAVWSDLHIRRWLPEDHAYGE